MHITATLAFTSALYVLQIWMIVGEQYTVGYITGSHRRPGDRVYPRPGLLISGAITLAVEEVNNKSILGQGRTLNFVIAETYGEEEESLLQVAQLWKQNISGYIGPQETCIFEARLAASLNLPMISYFCAHNQTSDKSMYPTFARTRPPDYHISKSVASVLLRFNWRQVAFFHHFDMSMVSSTIVATLESVGITIRERVWWTGEFHFGYGTNLFSDLVQKMYTNARIFVILGRHDDHLGLLAAMDEKGLFKNGEYFVVGVNVEQYEPEKPISYFKGFLRDEADPAASRYFHHFLGVMASPSVDFRNFTAKVNHYLKLEPFCHKNPLDVVHGYKVIQVEAAYLYDAVHLYAQALRQILDEGGSALNGTAVIERIRGVNYHSAMGYMVHMDENGDPEGNYTLVARQPHLLLPGEYGIYPVGAFRLSETKSMLPDLHLTADIDWFLGYPPVAAPECGFQGEKCVSNTKEIMAGVAGVTVLLLSSAALLFYRNWRYERALDSLVWRVSFRELQMAERTQQPSRTPMAMVRTSQASLNSNPDAELLRGATYTQVAVLRGRLVAVKTVGRRCVEVTRVLKKELKMMRELRHDNLLGFVGACVEPAKVCVLTEYCARGSLKDILDNEDVKLDNMFVASLVGDIVRGMIYLHDSAVRSHGALRSSNCLVDSRWVVKIADFGLLAFKKGADPPDLQKTLSDLQYCAPEILRNPHPIPGGTQKGDVYSFGIVLYELLGRKGPWGELSLPAAEILKRVVSEQKPGHPPFRPSLGALGTCFDCVRECLTECWMENPDERPEFKVVRTRLRPLRKGMKPNIMDNMLAMMETYANCLEALVDERTSLLIEEKKKTDALLHEMLPPCVANQLRGGRQVQPEQFDCVTVYFSDIVGFTAMSAQSTPLQVVDFLNDLYTCFDSVIGGYDVYKVETIGDAYMVVSGLPIRNGDQHAAEVASLSLHLLESVRHFRVRHRPSEALQLRIGVHSGPVCAGVVGQKMPRYCLFGDTVNTASRMESTGEPLKIHCSSTSTTLLLRVGGYQVEERGVTNIKGKGEMITYWLVGEDLDRRKRREEERKKKMVASSRKCERAPANGAVPRSSLRKAVGRALSLESPKRLRFAADDSALNKNDVRVPLLSEHKRNSCPCIEDLIDVSLSASKLNNSDPTLPDSDRETSVYETVIDMNSLVQQHGSKERNGKLDENITKNYLFLLK